MQFVCDRCKAKYDIDEARLRGKAVKIRCRGCGNILEVRDPNLPAGAQPSIRPPPTPPHGRPRVATPLGRKAVGTPPAPGGSTKAPGAATKAPGAPPPPGALGERFQKAFEGPGVTPGPGTLPATKPAAPAAADASDEATHILANPFVGAAAQQAVAEDVSRKLARWHVAIRNQPMGPMSEDAIRRHIEDDAVGINSLVWREGFDEWRPLGQVRDLAYLAELAAKKKGGATGKVTWRESIFELPPAARAAVTRAGATSLVPPAPGWSRWLVHVIVAVVAFALGMLFMYVVSGSAPQPAAVQAPEPTGVPVEHEAASSQPLPTIRSGSLTIQLANPTVVAQEELEPPVEGAPAAGGSTSGGSRTGVRSSGGGTSRADAGSAALAPVLPGRDLGPVGGQIRTGGPSTAAGGAPAAQALSAQQILPVVSDGESGIQHCYDQARARDFVADLSLRLTIEISPDGSVRNATLASDDYILGDLENCILGRVRSWHFPRASAVSRVVLPFAFHQ